MNIFDKLENLRVVIVTHEYATGPSHALETYLNGKVKQLAFIAHPFVFSKEKRSHIRVTGKKEYFFPIYIQAQFLNVLKDILLTVYWCVRFGKIDLYVGADNINASVGIILQKMGFVRTTVFYTIDYIPHRFNNFFMNILYHQLDAFAVKHVNMVWNLSSIMTSERVKVGLSSPTLQKKQIVVPMGTDEIIRPLPYAQIQRYTIAHMGHLVQKQGVHNAILAIPFIRKRLPHFHLDIIGGGPMEKDLVSLAQKIHVEKHVTFYGYIPRHDDVERLLSRCAAAIAPYVDNEENFVRYTDPGKVKAYLSVGLPIIITKVPDIWKTIVHEGAGVATTDTPKALADATIVLLSNSKILIAYRKKAALLGAQYRWDRVFRNALSQTL